MRIRRQHIANEKTDVAVLAMFCVLLAVVGKEKRRKMRRKRKENVTTKNVPERAGKKGKYSNKESKNVTTKRGMSQKKKGKHDGKRKCNDQKEIEAAKKGYAREKCDGKERKIWRERK